MTNIRPAGGARTSEGAKKLQERIDFYEELVLKRLPREIERIMQDCNDVETVGDLEWLIRNIKGSIPYKVGE